MERSPAGDTSGRRRGVVRGGGPAVCLLVVLALLPGSPVRAQAPVPVGTVTEVQVLQEGQPVIDPDILSLVSTMVGAPFSMVDVRESRNHLDGVGRFDVEVRSETTPTGIRVVYELTPLRPIDRIEFRGNLQLSESTLRQAVRERLGSSMFISRA